MDKQELAAQNNRLLRAIVGMLALTWPADAERVEYVLAGGGLGYQEIAELLGKKPDAVRMLLKRQHSSKNISKLKNGKNTNNDRGVAGD